MVSRPVKKRTLVPQQLVRLQRWLYLRSTSRRQGRQAWFHGEKSGIIPLLHSHHLRERLARVRRYAGSCFATSRRLNQQCRLSFSSGTLAEARAHSASPLLLECQVTSLIGYVTAKFLIADGWISAGPAREISSGARISLLLRARTISGTFFRR